MIIETTKIIGKKKIISKEYRDMTLIELIEFLKDENIEGGIKIRYLPIGDRQLMILQWK